MTDSRIDVVKATVELTIPKDILDTVNPTMFLHVLGDRLAIGVSEFAERLKIPDGEIKIDASFSQFAGSESIGTCNRYATQTHQVSIHYETLLKVAQSPGD